MKRLRNERSAKFFLGVLTEFVPGLVLLVGFGVIPVHSSKDVSIYQPERKDITPTIQTSRQSLAWPIEGPIAAYYGPGHPLGIDIDLGFRQLGTEELQVKAATEGEVVFAGGNPCCSYGNYLVIMSLEGVETLYAHLAEIKVFQGEQVKQGEMIAIAGSTGYSTGIHLHFEVIDNGVRVNPIDYLP